MIPSPQEPWAVFCDLHSQADSPILNQDAWAVDEALNALLDEIADDQISADPQKVLQRFKTLRSNRAAKHRRRHQILAAAYFRDSSMASIVEPFPIVAHRENLEHVRQHVTAAEWSLLCHLAMGHTYQEVAQHTGCIPQNLKPKVSRLRARLACTQGLSGVANCP